MRCGRLSLSSAMTLSALRKRYFLPNIAVTEQKVQSKGQPQLVMIGMVVSRSLPTSRRRSGNGSSSRSARASRGRIVHREAVALERQAGDGVELAVAGQRLDELEHQLFAALAAGHVVHVLQRLVGHEGDVRPADDDGDALAVEVLGEPVGRRRRGGRAREADQVGRVDVVPVDGRHGGVVDEHVVPVRLEGGGDDGQPEAGEKDLGPDVHPGRFGLDQADLHCAP